jgi:C1A family cysteine protease
MRQDPRTIIDIEQDPGLNRKPIYQSVTKPILPFKIAKYHWTPDKPDSRDHKYSITYKDQPNIVDLRPYCTPIENQGNLGSCTGQSIAGAIELLNKRANKILDASRLFIYYYERLILGTINYDSGAYIRDGIKASYTYGTPVESLWPYDITKFKLAPSTAAKADALKRKVTSYQRIENHEGCLDALNNGYPVVIGFNVYTSFESASVARTGIMPYPNTKKERLLGGHAVLLVGYDKTKKVYIVRNSWGTGWGDRGYFYMPFQVIQNPQMSSDFWIIKSVNNP